MDEISHVLASTDKALDVFIIEIEKSPPKSKKPIDELSTVLIKNSEQIQHHLKKIKKEQVTTHHSSSETKLIQQLLRKLEMIKNNKITQEKVGALQATLFWDYIEDFHNLLLNKNLKDQHKRGERVEKIDPIDTEGE